MMIRQSGASLQKFTLAVIRYLIRQVVLEKPTSYSGHLSTAVLEENFFVCDMQQRSLAGFEP